MTFIKHEYWTEAEIDALPQGEHDYFERKSGLLFNDTGELLGKLGKTISALSNSGGGYIILGVDDSGIPDGVPPLQGNTSVREWLEQKIPYLVYYPLSDFRVHIVGRGPVTRIPVGREVIVIDIGDSPLAPHQCARGSGGSSKYMYYYRQAGRSEPAPHFYLELLRQRLVNPVLEIHKVNFAPWRARKIDESIFLATHIDFTIKNVGRVAAYKWKLHWVGGEAPLEDRVDDYRYQRQQYPPGIIDSFPIRGDETILPGTNCAENMDWGVFLRPTEISLASIENEIEQIIIPVKLNYRLATETSQGDVQIIDLQNIVDAKELAEYIVSQISS